MLFIHSLPTLSKSPARELFGPGACVGVSIGNFDGMHLGHQALFRTLNQEVEMLAAKEGLRPVKVLFTFARHPRIFFSKARAREKDLDPSYWTLTSLRRKIEIARDCGFDAVLAVRFGRSFSQLDAAGFVDDCLIRGLRAQLAVVGYDWRFGRDRQGTAELLQELGSEAGFRVHIVPEVRIGDQRVSSSAVRHALEEGNLVKVEQLLGRPFDIVGRVRQGSQRGRQLGFPTANIITRRQYLPLDGVYAGRMILEGRTLDAVANIGVRPTFGGGERIVEIHVLEQSGLSLYGKCLRLEFHSFLRPERAFASITELAQQIRQDCAAARHALATAS